MRIIAPEYGIIGKSVVPPHTFARLRRFDFRSHGKRRIFDWSRERELRIQNFVGIVQVPGLTIEILPKAGPLSDVAVNPSESDAKAWTLAQKNLLYMLAIAGWLPFEERDLATQRTSRMPLFEALVWVFADRLLRELRRGIDRSYVRREENLHLVRGKILTTQSIRLNAARRDRLFVGYEDFVADTMLNRILKATCFRLLGVTSRSDTQQRLRECIIDLADVEDTPITLACFDEVHLTRNSERFEPLLEFARLVFLQMPPQSGFGKAQTFSLLFPMEILFQQFIGRLIHRNAGSLGLSRQQVVLQSSHRSNWLVHTPAGAGKFLLKPDALILSTSGGVSSVLDTKWKRLKSDDEDQKNGVLQSDMYQLFAYAHRFDCRDNILLFPKMPGVSTKTYHVHDGQQLRVLRSEVFDLQLDLSRSKGQMLNQLRTILRTKLA